MISSKELKAVAKTHHADLVGIASMDRFEGAPMQADPRYIFPGAKAMIVCASRIPRGVLIGIEEGTFFQSYSMMGYAGINFVRMPMVLWGLTAFLEDAGYDAVPLANHIPWSGIENDNGRPRRGGAGPSLPTDPRPTSSSTTASRPSPRGWGEIGYSKVFLTPEFGPRQRFGAILTNAPLDPDPIFTGTVRSLHALRADLQRPGDQHHGDGASRRRARRGVGAAGRGELSGRLPRRQSRAEPVLPHPPENIMWHGEAWRGPAGASASACSTWRRRGRSVTPSRSPSAAAAVAASRGLRRRRRGPAFAGDPARNRPRDLLRRRQQGGGEPGSFVEAVGSRPHRRGLLRLARRRLGPGASVGRRGSAALGSLLKELRALGVDLHLLLNANCYGELALSAGPGRVRHRTGAPPR